MGRKDHGLDLYSPKASPWKEREDLREGFDFGNFGKRRRRRLGEGGTPDMRGRPVSDARGKKENAALASWACGGSLGSAQAEERRAREDGPRGGSGGELEQATGKDWAEMKIFVFFFLFNYFKVFSNNF
jgi:hypothetical protein